MASFQKLFNARDHFGRDLGTLVLPIVVQNLITSSVSMADVVMLGRLDQTSLSASSLAGQVQFLLNIVYFGLNSALTILASQYWGKKDTRTISKILGIGLIISLICSGTATILALACPGVLIRIWTNVPELQEAGAAYLQYVALSYFFMGLTQPYHTILKSCERVVFSTVVSAVTLGLNVCLNAVLIFGLFGAPAMGIRGAAAATVIARLVECIICLADYLHQDQITHHLSVMFRIPGSLIQDFIRYCLPAFINDAMWGLAFNMNSVIMGHLGSDIVAANSVVTVARDLISVVGFGISSASSILLGKEIGENQLELTRRDASSILRTAFLISILQGLLLLALSPVIPGFVRLSSTAAFYLRVMLYINCVYQIGQVINTILISSYFRCGGDSRYGMVLDIVCMWCVAVPLGLISAFVLKLPPLAVYCLMCTDEFVKMPFALHHYYHGNWIHNLTRDYS